MRLKAALAGLISLAWMHQAHCEGLSNPTEEKKWACTCFTNLSTATMANCSSSCDCSPDGSLQSRWKCRCAAEGLPVVAAEHNNTCFFTSCSCSFGTPTRIHYPKKWISRKDLFVVLFICSAVANLAFFALMLCGYIIYQRKTLSSQQYLFSLDKEMSFSSGTNLISQRASSEAESKVYPSTSVNIASGCIPKVTLLFKSKMGSSSSSSSYGMIVNFSYFDLETATDKFSNSNLIGVGGSSQVYRGQLKDGRIVAVKRIETQGGPDSETSFLTEIKLISRLHHCHVVPLLGYCLEQRGNHAERLLVFEYMANGNLRDFLDGGASGRCSDWGARVRIAFGAARGLEYLHEAAAPRILHRDVKSTNVLLDENWRAKITDLGMAKLLHSDGGSGSSCSSSPARMQGTFGYFAPEYAIVGRASLKSDVFSFGVVLLELITGRHPIQRSVSKGREESLVVWATPRLQDSKLVISELPDPNMKGAFEEEEMQVMAYLAKECLLLDPDSRPTMSEVVQILSTIAPEKSKRNYPLQGHNFKRSLSYSIERSGRRVPNPSAQEEIKHIANCEKHDDHNVEIYKNEEVGSDQTKQEERVTVTFPSKDNKRWRPQDDAAVDLIEPRFESFHEASIA